MARFVVRRLTAGLILVALLALAAPAAAAPASWSLPPASHTPSLLGQVLAWIAHLWAGDEPQGQATREKASDPGFLTAPETDRSGALDPNGSY